MNKITEFIKDLSIRTLIIVFILIYIITAMFAAISISNGFISDFVMDKYLTEYLNTVYTTFESNMNITVSQLNMLVLTITSWDRIYLTLTDGRQSFDEKTASVTEALNTILKDYPIIDGVDIIVPEGKISYSKGCIDFKTPDSITAARSSLTFHNKTISCGDKNYVAASSRFYNFFNNYDLGYLVLYINEDTFYSMYKDSIIGNSTLFVTANDYIISHPDKSELGSKCYIPHAFFSDDRLSIGRYETSIVGKYTFSNGINIKISLIAVISAAALYKIVFTINRSLTVLCIITLAAAIVLTFLFSKKLLKSLFDLKNGIEVLGSDPAASVSFKTSNEIKALENSFIKMSQRIKRLMKETEDANERHRAAELKALQIHINPHFIYNALDIITCMAKLNGNKDIETTTCALASFFRIGLSKGSPIITVADEIRHVQSYAYVEHQRFPDLFDIEYDIPTEISEGCYIIKIVLQPLVENSIKHGFSNIDHKGKIRISAVEKDGDIYISVFDNGIGIKKSGTNGENIQAFGYGLKNVQQRLELEYGKGYGLIFSEAAGGGTCVTVKIKKITEINDEKQKLISEDISI